VLASDCWLETDQRAARLSQHEWRLERGKASQSSVILRISDMMAPTLPEVSKQIG
jgi:hypothetical protein